MTVPSKLVIPDQEESGPDWVRDAVFYQIFPDRFANGDPANDPPGTVAWDSPPSRENFFGGDLQGICERLPYLEALGVNALYLTPIFKAGTNHRYDTHDYLEVDPALGDKAVLRDLVADAHARGIRVVLDGVFNHCGEGFWAFRDVAERGRQSPYWHWFFVRHWPLVREPPSYQTCGGAPYLPKLNTAHPDLRRYLLDVAAHWMEEVGVDGWRLDVPWKVPIDFWAEFRRIVKERKPDAYLVGEAWQAWGGLLDVFDGLMNYRLRRRLLDFCLDGSADAEDLAVDTEALLAETGSALMLNLLGSHDTPRLLTLARGDVDRTILALTALFTFPGTPLLYYGDEHGMEGEDDPDCRRAAVWSEERWNGRIHEAVRRLIALRHVHPALRRGSWSVELAFNRVLAYRRSAGDDEIVVVLNAGPAIRDVEISIAGSPRGAFEDGLSDVRYVRTGPRLVLPELPALSTLVLRPVGADGR